MWGAHHTAERRSRIASTQITRLIPMAICPRRSCVRPAQQANARSREEPTVVVSVNFSGRWVAELVEQVPPGPWPLRRAPSPLRQDRGQESPPHRHASTRGSNPLSHNGLTKIP
jgi:hypothetical protein